MTVRVKTPEKAKSEPTFQKGELVISKLDNNNIYFVTGMGRSYHLFAGIRLSGKGEFAEYNNEYLKEAVELFEGELVISNE